MTGSERIVGKRTHIACRFVQEQEFPDIMS
jgi:hypothetical protein